MASCMRESVSKSDAKPYDHAGALGRYSEWVKGVIVGIPAASPQPLNASWQPGSPYWSTVLSALDEAEVQYVRDLLRELKTTPVPGAVMEFGVYQGRWLKQLADLCDELDFTRPIFGFDSFEGLPEVSAQDDLDCWHKGQYRSDIESVSKFVNCAKHENLRLVKGWFSQSLRRPDIQAIDAIAYVRIDADLYQSSKEVLEYVGPRLSDGAIMVFDDWTCDLEKGETKAFAEWQAGSGFMFEFLACSMWHYYFRAKRKP